MSKKTKVWLIVAASLIFAGLLIFCGAAATVNWDFRKLGTSKYQTHSAQIMENFDNISIDTDTADIFFVPSTDGICLVEYYEKDDVCYSAVVRDNTLNIKREDYREWYKYISFNFEKPKITIYLPNMQYNSLYIKESTGDIVIPKTFSFKDADITLSTGDVEFSAVSDAVKIKTSTGDVDVEDTTLGSLDVCTSTGDISLENIRCADDMQVEVTTGEVEIENVTCKNLTPNGDTGSILLENTIATQKLSVTRDTGSVKFEKSDAAEIVVKTDTGKITGSLLTNKVFIAHSDTGFINVPQTTTGGKCRLTTDTGKIIIEIVK